MAVFGLPSQYGCLPPASLSTPSIFEHWQTGDCSCTVMAGGLWHSMEKPKWPSKLLPMCICSPVCMEDFLYSALFVCTKGRLLSGVRANYTAGLGLIANCEGFYSTQLRNVCCFDNTRMRKTYANARIKSTMHAKMTNNSCVFSCRRFLLASLHKGSHSTHAGHVPCQSALRGYNCLYVVLLLATCMRLLVSLNTQNMATSCTCYNTYVSCSVHMSFPCALCYAGK